MGRLTASRWVLVVGLALAGCTASATPSATTSVASAAPPAGTLSVATATASASSTAAAGDQIRISAVPGTAVDRPSFAQPAGLSVAGIVKGLGDDLSAYADQKLTWTACSGQVGRCATVLAPLDYANPAGRAVTLALRKLPATAKPRLGTLFVNPGGPGASGRELLDSFRTTGLEQYDIVGWDPRGTGASTPVRCLSGAEVDAYDEVDATPDDQAERDALIRAVYGFASACWQRNGDLLEHISTIDTVRDLDLLRRLVGDAKLNFLGYSYGTQIGATYADLFAQHTGRLVLDAAVNVTDDTESVIQAQGFDLALSHFAQWCATQNCALGSTKQAVIDSVTGLWDHLDAHPLQVKTRRLTQSLGVTGVAAMLYGGTEAWSGLSLIVHAAIEGNGAGLLAAADALNGRADDGSYDPMIFAFPAISCLDSTDKGVLDADRQWIHDAKLAPVFGKYLGPQYTCALWPVRPAVQLTLTGTGAAPLLVIGGTGDNATPYQYAKWMAAQLTSAVLVTYKGEGHGSYGGKSACIDDHVVDFLVKGVVPARGLTCS